MEEKELRTGWLSPSGELCPCYSYDHIEEARAIVKRINIANHENGRPDDALIAAGWVYIGTSSMGPSEWRIAWGKFLTEYQKNFLKPYFEQTAIPVNNMTIFRWKEENGLLDEESYIDWGVKITDTT